MSAPEMPQNPQQPAAPASQPTPAPAAASYSTAVPAQAPVAAEPGNGLTITAMILAFFMPLVGLILGIVALVQAKKAGRKNGLALAATIIGAVLTVVVIIVVIFVTIALIAGAAFLPFMSVSTNDFISAAEACLDGASYVEVMGQTLSCEEVLAQ